MASASDSSEPQLSETLSYLISSANDREPFVRESSCKALQALSSHYSAEVIESISDFRLKNAKVPEHQLLILLNVFEHIANANRDLQEEDVSKIVAFCVNEVSSTETSQSTKRVASDALINLGLRHSNQVLSALFPLVQMGGEPNPSVLDTLGKLALSNATQCVPVIKSVLNLIVPIMPVTRNEVTRISLSFAVGKFCEAVLEYLDYPNEERDESISKDTFSEEIVQAYSVIANSWVQAKEIKVIESAINALGPVFSLLPEEKAGQATSRAVTCLLSAYKKPCIPHHSITACLAVIMKAAPPTSLLPLMDQILYNLGAMVVTPPDYSVPHTVKQNNELLRCYDHLGKQFSERLGDHIVRHLRLGNERDTVEALIVSAHLISGSDNILASRINEITSAVRATLQDSSVKVRKALVKTIVALCCKEHAADGSDFIEFLVRHCEVTPAQNGLEYKDLANTCTATIQLLSSTLGGMSRLLWTTMLKLSTDPYYDYVAPVLFQSLTQLAQKQDPKDGEVSRELVLCRCFALLGCPLNNNRGPSILVFLEKFSPFVSPHISDLWAHKLPQLLNYLQVSEWSESEWDSLLLEMIHNTVTTISCHDPNWALTTSRHLSVMAPASPDEASVVLSSLAITTAVIEDKNLVSEHLDTILFKFKTSQIHMKECARAVGILATAHLDLVLTRLDTLAQTELNRRNSRLLGLMKDSKADAEIERSREAILECYAAIAHRCPLMELLPKLDALTTWITSQLNVAKETSGREAALEAILNCAESLVRHKSEARHTIKCRTHVLNVVLQMILTQPKPDPLTIKAVTLLAKLPPSLVVETRLHILKTCFDRILALDPPTTSADKTLALQSLKQLGELVEELLMESVTPDRLDEITTLLSPWLKHSNPGYRRSAITVLRTSLLAYYHNMEHSCQNPSTLNQCGDLMGSLIVRYFDSDETVSKIAAHCAGIVLAIASVYDGHSHDQVLEKIFEDLPEENRSEHVSKILCGRLPSTQLHRLTGRLLDGLTDCDKTAASNSADVLAAVFTLKGAELFHHVNDILGSLLLQLVSESHQTNGISGVVALGRHHPKLVLSVLLKQPLPLHVNLSDCWKALAYESNLNSFALDHILQVLSTAPLFDEDPKGQNRPKIAAFHPLAAVSGLSEMATCGNRISDLLKERLHILIPSLMTILAAYIGASPPILSLSPSKTIIITNRDAYKILPSRVIRDCLQRVLLAVDCTSGAEALLSSSNQLQHIESLITVIPQLTLSICTSFPQLLPKLMAALNEYNETTSESQKMIITAFYAECLAVQSSCGGSTDLVDALVTNLLTAVSAPDPSVRAIALKGLSYIKDLPPALRDVHEDAALSALMEGLDEGGALGSRVPFEAVHSLSRLVPFINVKTLNRVQVPLALRVKLFFEKEEIGLRATSLRLFGQLYIPDNEDLPQSGYRDQVISCFGTLLLHLSEPEPAVVKSCKSALRAVSPLLGTPYVSELIQKHLLYNGVLQFEAFASSLVEGAIKEMPDIALSMFNSSLAYTKSNWSNIRGNAAVLLGLIYKCSDPSLREKLVPQRNAAVTRLYTLLKDPNSEVRAKSIKSLPLLHSQCLG